MYSAGTKQIVLHIVRCMIVYVTNPEKKTECRIGCYHIISQIKLLNWILNCP